MKKQSNSSSIASQDERDTILWCNFDYAEVDNNNTRNLCLILGYANGIQIWNLEDPQNIHEVISKREGPIKLAKVYFLLIFSIIISFFQTLNNKKLQNILFMEKDHYLL